MLRVENLSKKFGSVYALKGVDFKVSKGEVHGIVGANGSGKSTLLNILFGDKNIQNTGGYSGEVFIDDLKVNINNTMSAIGYGIGKVYQEFALVENMDIASNVKINNENVYQVTKKVATDGFAYVNKKQNHVDAKNIFDKFNIAIDTKQYVKDVSVNIKQFIEIAREIDKKDLKLLLLDEPTACLNKEDASTFINIIKTLKDKGIAIIFISHRLDEVVELCDKVTVLRDGSVVSRYEKDEFDVEKIAIDMIGKKVQKTTKANGSREIIYDECEKVLSFNNLSIHDNNKVFEDINIDIFKGEILGITSLAGHGHTMISNSIMGMYQTNGEILYNGNVLDLDTPHKTIQQGIVMIPEERKEMGVLLDSSIKENIIFTSLYSKNNFLKLPRLKGLSFLDKKNINSYVDDCIKNFNIKCDSKKQHVKELSGGNQQKICIARALSTEPNVLFISEPTRGIDIYSKEIILKMLLETNKNKNTTIIISSSEIEELKRICDRIIVMYEGKVFDELSPNEDEEVFSLAISGKRRISREKN